MQRKGWIWILMGVLLVGFSATAIGYAAAEEVIQVTGHTAINRVYDEDMVGKEIRTLVVREVLSREEGERVEQFLRDKWCLLPMWNKAVVVDKLASEAGIKKHQAEDVAYVIINEEKNSTVGGDFN